MTNLEKALAHNFTDAILSTKDDIALANLARAARRWQQITDPDFVRLAQYTVETLVESVQFKDRDRGLEAVLFLRNFFENLDSGR